MAPGTNQLLLESEKGNKSLSPKFNPNLRGRTAGGQYFLDYIDLYAASQSSTQLPNRAANTSLLHFPLFQHLVHHLWQAVALIVMLNGLYFHLG